MSDAFDVQTRALNLCRLYGAGSREYASFLEEVNSTLMGSMFELPKFVPGDIKNANAAKHRKKKKQRHLIPPRDVNTIPVVETQPVKAQPLEKINEEMRQSWESTELERPFRSMQRSMTTDHRNPERNLQQNLRAMRRSHTTLGNAEQITMDEQVALQLQTLVREKAELIKENSRLKNENEGLKTLLEYATYEATVDDGEESDFETSKEVLRNYAGIQAWHPPELLSPTSYSSYGMLGSTSSNDEKDVHGHIAEDVDELSHIRT